MIKDVVFKPEEIGNSEDVISTISKKIHSGKKLYITKPEIEKGFQECEETVEKYKYLPVEYSM